MPPCKDSGGAYYYNVAEIVIRVGTLEFLLELPDNLIFDPSAGGRLPPLVVS